jgi:hypothetical protein
MRNFCQINKMPIFSFFLLKENNLAQATYEMFLTIQFHIYILQYNILQDTFT